MVASDGITNSRPNRSRHSLAGDTETRTDKRPGCQLSNQQTAHLDVIPRHVGWLRAGYWREKEEMCRSGPACLNCCC